SRGARSRRGGRTERSRTRASVRIFSGAGGVDRLHPVIYLDNNATTRPSDATVREMARALTEFWQNPSSIHRPGQAARQAIDLARKSIAALVGARPREITFTGSGTESIVAAIVGSLRQTTRRVVVSTPVEHNAV